MMQRRDRFLVGRGPEGYEAVYQILQVARQKARRMHVHTPAEVLAPLFSRGELPEEIVVVGRFTPFSPVRIGERYVWCDSQPGVGMYHPRAMRVGAVCLMAHEVRRHMGKFYLPFDQAAAVA
jgi:hypothetical protein